MKKLMRFLFETDYGPFVSWGTVALAFCAVVIVSAPLGKVGLALVLTMLLVLVVLSLAAVVAFLLALIRCQWMRAIGQFCLGIIGIVLFFIAVPVSLVGSRIIAHSTSSDVRTAEVKDRTEVTDRTAPALAFKVEFRPSHLFLAEYDKCIVFQSGKRIGVWMDTGGAGAFAVYRLPNGEYYLVDGLKHDFIRNDYRVNVTNETVEIMCDETWVKIPDGTLAVVGRGGDSITVKTASGEKNVSDGNGTSVGDSLKERVYLGLLRPNGRFVTGMGDPYADVLEAKWVAVEFDGGKIPFSLECSRWKGSCRYRLAFASGEQIALDFAGCADDSLSLCRLDDGRYHLFDARRADSSWRKDWRIDATGETVEVMYKNHWGKYGNFWVKIPPGAISIGAMGIHGGENGGPIKVSIDVNTKKGKVTGHDFIPVGDSLSNERFIGSFHVVRQ